MLRAVAAPNLSFLLARAQLPALPQSAVRLLELSQNPENGPAQYAVPIEADPGLTSQVLRFVNSSYFGFRQEISSVKLAISLVGIRTIQNFALWNAIFSVVPDPKCGIFCLKKLWQDSLRRGLFARQLGLQLGLKNAEDLFAMALLQDMAVPILAKELPADYESFFQAHHQESARLSELEHEKFGWTHGDAGALLARAWRLPEEFGAVLAKHVDPAEACADRASPDLRIVGTSALLPSSFTSQWDERDAFLSAFQQLLPAAELTAEEVFQEIDDAFGEFAPVLHIPQPVQSLASALQPTLSAVSS